MPLYDFKCEDCTFKKEHFVYTNTTKLQCPKCNSDKYTRCFGKFRVDVQYANNTEYLERKLNPELKEMYAQIGKEALNEDSQTLDNIFGESQVRDTYGDSED
jgi:putative FmdB family regulatory protein